VVVYGYVPQLEQNSVESILQRFSQYGDIVGHLPGLGNWIFIKYVLVLPWTISISPVYPFLSSSQICVSASSRARL
jgi:TctA family transporter